ncbi:MAG: AMP-binding protein, partial [Planctomycetaceae bacterium]|nr:AMP-binding protein [Planctomycetaceae bacterium]
TGAQLLLRALIFRKLLERDILAPEERYVGVLLPPSAGGVLANVALPLAHRISVNLNYSASSAVMNSCIKQCGIRHVLTSRRVVQRMPHIQLDAELIFLEDFVAKVTKLDKLTAALLTYLVPAAWLDRLLKIDSISDDEVLTVLFTSGSTGEPKGVMLTHRNVGSNIKAINQTIHLTEKDLALGVLPFFHSYGYTATLWTMLALPPAGVYHFTPLEAQQVGELARKYRASILMITPTFLRSYLKRCEPEDFANLDVVFASAERLPPELADAFKAKFGVRPVEAYGATEMSPLVAVNIPPNRAGGYQGPTSKDGTVGRPIPGTQAKILHLETGEELGPDEPGMLWLTGPNVMKGYLNRPDLTAEKVRDGWYVTGDVAKLDRDGFITITGRESRFSKIGGEMVPHIKIEETIRQILGADEDQLTAVVTAVPDTRKGERLVVLHTAIEKSPEVIGRELAQAGLPNLWIPGADSFFEVEAIPVLGSGKVDLKAMKDLALERCGVIAGSH